MESLQTLKFGCQAKNIKTKIQRNQSLLKHTIDIETFKQLEEENHNLRQK